MPSQEADRHSLLLYARTVGRYRRPTFLLAALLLGLWYAVSGDMLPWPRPPTDEWLLAGGAVSAAAWLFVWLGPRLAYVQPRGNHLRLQTPIYRLKVSYRRIENTRPIDLVKMFPPSEQRGSGRRLLEPFYGRTALGVDLRGLPVPRWVLELYFSRYFVAADQAALVLIVNDWMALSSQLSSRIDAWKSARQARRGPISDAAAVLSAKRKRRSWWRR